MAGDVIYCDRVMANAICIQEGFAIWRAEFGRGTAMSLNEAGQDDLARCADKAKVWLFEHAAPLWSETGWHSVGLFAEQLDQHVRPDSATIRLRVQARQIYSFCIIGRLGWKGPWRARVVAALDTFLNRGRRNDGFFIHSFSDAAATSDARADLYDHAFVLFCLGHAGRALGMPELFHIANETMDLLEDHWRHPHGGFIEGEIEGPPRRQNPHMHLLEAALTLWKCSGQQRWQTLAHEIADLCVSRFWEPESGALTEYFNEDWSRLPGDEGYIAEPGHCLEWAWLFENLGDNHSMEISDRLVGFARTHGMHKQMHAIVNQVNVNGTMLDSGLRLWPQAERTRTTLARYRRTGDPEERREAVAAFHALELHLQAPTKGLWRERWCEFGWLDQPSPASSFYHIIGALSELIGLTGS